ncbi:dynein heavy chain binding protein [Aureococcus anophagefferens]|nr:dynein heavy chain binding protein [Aureococcus anophagefferens]
MAQMIPPHDSLVKYDNPILVSTTKEKGGKKKKTTPSSLPPVGANTQTEDILNSILPPREWTEDGTLWVQYVSSTPATRLDVINLQEQLDRKLQQRQARERASAPSARLYAQCFDEVIRQVTINCAERGLLLLRVRDEIRMTIAAYQTLYESSIAFGMRKALMAEHRKAEMQNKLIKEREEERKADAAKHEEEVTKYKKINEQLKTNLEAMLSRPSAPRADRLPPMEQLAVEKSTPTPKASAMEAGHGLVGVEELRVDEHAGSRTR